jgi:hypothetical protein
LSREYLRNTLIATWAVSVSDKRIISGFPNLSKLKGSAERQLRNRMPSRRHGQVKASTLHTGNGRVVGATKARWTKKKVFISGRSSSDANMYSGHLCTSQTDRASTIHSGTCDSGHVHILICLFFAVLD